jgi:DNA invertase Pin-like site-specific DNA recombinase
VPPLAEFERNLIRERTHAGLAAARKRGRLFGRPKALAPRKIEQLRLLTADNRNTVGEICQTLRISRATYYRYVKQAELFTAVSKPVVFETPSECGSTA